MFKSPTISSRLPNENESSIKVGSKENSHGQTMALELGDIIEIIAPSDPEINAKTYYIGYIDTDKIRLEEADGNETVLTFTEGNWDNESIESIKIKSQLYLIKHGGQLAGPSLKKYINTEIFIFNLNKQ